MGDRGETLSEFDPWLINGEVGGFVKQWENIAFMTVRGAGHEVPEYEPQRGLELWRRYITNNYSDPDSGVTELPKIPKQDYGADAAGTCVNHTARDFGLGLLLGLIVGVLLMYVFQCR